MKLFKVLGLGIAGVMSMFAGSPQIQHGQGGCCAECAIKAEDENKIEMIVDNKGNYQIVQPMIALPGPSKLTDEGIILFNGSNEAWDSKIFLSKFKEAVTILSNFVLYKNILLYFTHNI